jgi:transcriptional regulator with XRE-family HTH domain
MSTPTKTAPLFSGSRLADVRSRRKLTQVGLCDLVRPGLSIATYRRWEQGRAVPGADDLLRLAHVLGVDVRELAA